MPHLARTGLASLTVIAAACGGGSPPISPPPPPPVVTLAVTEATVTPTSVLRGDTVSMSGRGSASDGSTPNVAITYLGTTLASAAGSAAARLAPTSGGNGAVIVSRSGSTTATQAFTVAVTPLTATGTPSATTVQVGQNVGYTLSAPAGTDSLEARTSDARRFVVAGNTGVVQIPVSSAGTLTLTPAAFNAAAKIDGTPATITATPPNGTLRILVAEVTNLPLLRTNVTVGVETINVPADTIIIRPQGTFAIGIGAVQPEAYVYGEMEVNGGWRPLASNYLTHNVTLGAANTATITLISKAQPNFSGAAKAQHDIVWPAAADDSYHPTKLRDFEVWLIENPTGIYAQACAPMSADDKTGALATIDALRTEDAAGPDGARRTFAYRTGDPVAAEKFVPNGAGVKPAPGVIALCRTIPGGQTNAQSYDAQGFLESVWIRDVGHVAWTAEPKDFRDMVYRGQEFTGSNTLTSHSNAPVTNLRTTLDSFTYNHPLRIAWKAGQNNWGLLKVPR